MADPNPPSNPPPDDAFATWLDAARHGSQADLGRVLEACRGYLLAMAEVELGSTLRPKAGASDLVQDSLMEAQKGFEQFQGGGRDEFLAWVARILKHNVADLARRYRDTLGRDVAREESMGADPRPAIPEPRGDQPLDLLAAAEDAAQLQAAIARLPAEVRDIILWRQHDRLGWDEIGRRIDKSPDAARKIWFRAVERLREELNTDHDPTG